MEHTLSLKGYAEFDAGVTKKAIEDAEELITCYNRGEYNYSYTTNQTKPVEDYKLMKVWHIMSGSGIFFTHTVTKVRKDPPTRIRVRIMMSRQIPDYWDSYPWPSAKSETATPAQGEPPTTE